MKRFNLDSNELNWICLVCFNFLNNQIFVAIMIDPPSYLSDLYAVFGGGGGHLRRRNFNIVVIHEASLVEHALKIEGHSSQ